MADEEQLTEEELKHLEMGAAEGNILDVRVAREIRFLRAEAKRLKEELGKDNEPHYLWVQLRPGLERVASLIDNLELERDQARAEVERLRNLQDKALQEACEQLDEWKRRGEQAEKEVERLKVPFCPICSDSGHTICCDGCGKKREEARIYGICTVCRKDEVEKMNRAEAAEKENFQLSKEVESLKSWGAGITMPALRETEQRAAELEKALEESGRHSATQKGMIEDLDRRCTSNETTIKALREALEAWVHWAQLEHGRTVVLSGIKHEFADSVEALGGWRCQCEHCLAELKKGG